jgi:DNA-binding CsgD family transcriptional regulator
MLSFRQMEDSHRRPFARKGWNAPDESFHRAGVSLSRILSSSTVGVALFDASFHCQALNAVLRRMTGVSAKKTIGKPIDQILPGAAPQLEIALRRVWVQGNSLSNVELTEQLPASTEPRRWLLNFYPIKKELGQVWLVAATVFEVTKDRCVELKLGRLRDKFRSEMLSQPSSIEEEFSELSARTFELVHRSVALLKRSVSVRCYASETRLEARLVPLCLTLTVARRPEPAPDEEPAPPEYIPGLASGSGISDESELAAACPSFRERQVLRLLADGKSNKEIAVALELATRTVESYRARIMIKLDLHSTAALVRYAVRQKIVEA